MITIICLVGKVDRVLLEECSNWVIVFDVQIRIRMIEMVSHGQATVEV